MSFSLPSVASVVTERLSHIRKSSPVSGPGSTRRIERFKTQVRDLNNRPYENDGSQESWRYKQDYARLQRKANKLSNSGVAPRFSRLFSCLKSGQSAKLATKENTMKEVRQTLESIESRINGKGELSGAAAGPIHKPVDELADVSGSRVSIRRNKKAPISPGAVTGETGKGGSGTVKNDAKPASLPWVDENGDVFFDALEYFKAPEDENEFFDVWEDGTASVDSSGSDYDSVSTWSSDSENLLPDATAALEPAGADALTHTDDLADQRSVSSDGTGTIEHNEPSLTESAMQPVSARGSDTGIAAGQADRQTRATRSLDSDFLSGLNPEYKPVYQNRRSLPDLDAPKPVGDQGLSSGHSKSDPALNANSGTPAPASFQSEISSRRNSVSGNDTHSLSCDADESAQELDQKSVDVDSSPLIRDPQTKGGYKKTLKSARKGVKGFSKVSGKLMTRGLQSLAALAVGKRGSAQPPISVAGADSQDLKKKAQIQDSPKSDKRSSEEQLDAVQDWTSNPAYEPKPKEAGLVPPPEAEEAGTGGSGDTRHTMAPGLPETADNKEQVADSNLDEVSPAIPPRTSSADGPELPPTPDSVRLSQQVDDQNATGSSQKGLLAGSEKLMFRSWTRELAGRARI